MIPVGMALISSRESSYFSFLLNKDQVVVVASGASISGIGDVAPKMITFYQASSHACTLVASEQRSNLRSFPSYSISIS